MEEETVYRWTFQVWPIGDSASNNNLPNADGIIIAMMGARLEAYYTETRFELARQEMLTIGWVLHDIEKWPIVEPEFIKPTDEEVIASGGSDSKWYYEGYYWKDSARLDHERHDSQF